MYRHLQSLAVFVAVGEAGAFVKAAARLGVTPSVVSHHISRLEDELGETLIHRTTRKLTLSENGRRLFEATRGSLSDVEQALTRVKSNAEEIAGALRIALPAFVPDPALEEGIMGFAKRHPNVALSLDYTDHVVDLVDGAYDLSIRLGELSSSTLIRRKISSVTHLLAATEEFILQHGRIAAPDELASIPFVAMGKSFDRITLTKGQASKEVALDTGQIHVQSILGAKSATLAGLGFGNLPSSLIEKELASGELIQLLPDWELPKLSVQAVWSANSRRRALASRLVDQLSNF